MTSQTALRFNDDPSLLPPPDYSEASSRCPITPHLTNSRAVRLRPSPGLLHSQTLSEAFCYPASSLCRLSIPLSHMPS